MPRPLRIHYEGALFHVISRGNDKQDVFLDDADRLAFLDRLRRLRAESTFSIYAYCLMTNHIHMLVRVRQESISTVMLRLMSGYSREFNRKWDRRGHVFEAHPKQLHCARDTYFRELVRYIHMNPVSAGIVDAPERWKWSGYRELIGLTEPDLLDSLFVKSLFGSGPDVEEVMSAFTLRNEDFDLKWIERDQEELEPPPPIVPPGRAMPIERLLERVAESRQVTPGGLLSRSKARTLSHARAEFIAAAMSQGYRTCVIARLLGRNESVISRIGCRWNGKKGGERQGGHGLY